MKEAITKIRNLGVKSLVLLTGDKKEIGEKVGKVQSNLRSYKGVSEATVKTSYFWVTSVPDDDNKVEIEITVE